MILIIQQYLKKLIQFDKLYKNKDKFSGTEENFTFKLNIFYDKYQLVSFLSDTYFKNASIILIGYTYTHFYANYESIISFDDFCQKI